MGGLVLGSYENQTTLSHRRPIGKVIEAFESLLNTTRSLKSISLGSAPRNKSLEFLPGIENRPGRICRVWGELIMEGVVFSDFETLMQSIGKQCKR